MSVYVMYAADVKSDLYGFPASVYASFPYFILMGQTAAADRSPIIYRWDSSSVAVDDGYKVIQPTSVTGAGRLLLDYDYKRIETYTGTTDSSGNFSVIYSNAFSITPDVQPQLQAGSNTQIIKITASSITGFTVNVQNRTDTLGLLPNYSAVPGASVGVLVTSR